MVAEKGHVECVLARVWGLGAEVAAWATAECSALSATLSGSPFLLSGPLTYPFPKPCNF